MQRTSTHVTSGLLLLLFLLSLCVCVCVQKLEGRVASDEDLKLLDLCRYYDRDSQAALVRGRLL